MFASVAMDMDMHVIKILKSLCLLEKTAGDLKPVRNPTGVTFHPWVWLWAGLGGCHGCVHGWGFSTPTLLPFLPGISFLDKVNSYVTQIDNQRSSDVVTVMVQSYVRSLHHQR
jgi:hypothetical protein